MPYKDPQKRKEYSKQYRIKNFEKCRVSDSKYYQNNKEERKEQARQYRNKNKEKLKIVAKIYREKNKEEINKKQKEYNKKNKTKIRKNNEQYYKKNIEQIKIYRKEYYQKNIEKRKQQGKVYYQTHREKRKKYSKQYSGDKNNRVKINARSRIYLKKKRKIDIHYKISKNISNLIRSKMKMRKRKKDRNIAECLPYTIQELKEHLEKLFEPEMNWENHGKWHLDHIIPDSSFNYKSTKDEEFQKSWALKNLQPLWAKENMIKGNKIL